ncbi:sulfatase [Verrucomicrobium spinosum]|uniref:sulfatase n=2 Tax=Verrucomicrobium spinosum TaxID=2736 RepID=UPI0001746429|nr:sulfatase [Verrucomicrobium spinosum]
MKPPLIYAAALLCLSVMPAASAASARNVLFIVSDDLNTYLGCYGDPIAKTPNLDKLAASGVRFESANCAYPVCGASRNSFLTGLYPNANGVTGNHTTFRQTIPDHVSLPQAFRHAGYFAGRVGKLYHYGVPKSIGTAGHDDPASWEVTANPVGVDHLDEERDIFSLVPGQYGATLSWLASPSADARHTDGMVADDARWLLSRCAADKSRPFFVAMGFFRPHTPYVAPKAYFDLYPVEKMPLYPPVEKVPAEVPAAALVSYKKEQDQLTDDLRQQAVQAYYASISFMDAQVGRVVEELKQLGLAESTIIVFTSDHGYHMGEHGLWQKMSLFEASARVPLMIVAPGVAREGAVVKEPVSLVDLYPTLAELAGVPAPASLQGQSLVPLLKDPLAKGRGWALTQVTRANAVDVRIRPASGKSPQHSFVGYSLRTTRWRYTEWDEGRAGAELYDHEADPQELANLASRPELAQTVATLKNQLHKAVQSTFPPTGVTPPVKEGRTWYPVLSGGGTAGDKE